MRYLEFNGVKITSENETNYILNEFQPNEGTTERQEEIPYLYNGVMYQNMRYAVRVVNCICYIVADSEEELYKAKQKLYSACNGMHTGYLYWFDGYKKYKSLAVADIPSVGTIEGLCYQCNINFNLINFFWEEDEETNVAIGSREDVVSDSFTLPCVFTKRSSEGIIHNELDLDIYPQIKLQLLQSGSDEIIIKNEYTEEEIRISGYTYTNGEEIIIDLEKYTAESSLNGNIINYVSDFEEFKIEAGDNKVRAYVNNKDSVFNASVTYNKKLVGV